MTPRVLVVAKAPVPGRVKTRLAADLGGGAAAEEDAAELAALALLDTLGACAEAVGPDRCHLALAGDLAGARRADELRRALDGWRVGPQVGATFADRLAAAHAATPGPLLQVGMDTPQATAGDLAAAADGLADADAVLGQATDGGWWLLGLHDPSAAAVLAGVPMSTSRTGALTRAALVGRGLRVATTRTLRDVDRVADADAVAEEAPGTLFGRAWHDRAARTTAGGAR
ncbi:DUF2064 domain-containing protein [Nocardioides sp. YIM 152588]|uniref:DUF2064 domain-containing protein n=1 Tax=Nocardioides sp. YIM 152588 TaxID=3158259 RepID=UPI0032E3E22C